MPSCPYCDKIFQPLGIASHRAACGRKKREANARRLEILEKADENIKKVIAQGRRFRKKRSRLIKEKARNLNKPGN